MHVSTVCLSVCVRMSVSPSIQPSMRLSVHRECSDGCKGRKTNNCRVTHVDRPADGQVGGGMDIQWNSTKAKFGT